MIAKEQLREDLYKAIIGHYEKCDFTEALRDAMFFIRDVLQEKSGYVDKDNTSLVEASLLGKNPAIRINKFETQAEKDFQEGIKYLAIKNFLNQKNGSFKRTVFFKIQSIIFQILWRRRIRKNRRVL